MKLFLSIGLPVLAGLVFLVLILKSVKSGIEKYALERLRGVTLVKKAPFARMIGQKSRGMFQIRGNGYLALTMDAVYFFLAAPRRELKIPLMSIKQITFPTAFMGKTVFRKLLCISFDTPGGEGEDAVAWQVTDPDNWKAEIERAANKKFD